jgi:hypothetical protein
LQAAVKAKGTINLHEDFVKQSHQDGKKKEARSRNASNLDEAVKQQCKWEHKKFCQQFLIKQK